MDEQLRKDWNRLLKSMRRRTRPTWTVALILGLGFSALGAFVLLDLLPQLGIRLIPWL
jgi:hypothetical protein